MTKRITPLILIIDDDRFFLEFYRAELSQYNIETEFAEDGVEGLKKAQAGKPDMILLDVMLPKMDGFEVLKRLKADEATRDIPVLVISALGAESDKEKFVALGAVRSFNKFQNLPKDVATYIQEVLKIGFAPSLVPAETVQATFLDKEQIQTLFQDSLEEIDRSFAKLFAQPGQVEDLSVAMISGAEFEKRITELSQQVGTIFIYSNIKAEVPGVAVMSMRRDDTLSMIKLIGESVTAHALKFVESDRVIEEFFNIVINAFLTKLATSIHGTLILQPPTMSNARLVLPLLQALPVMKDLSGTVIFFEEAYAIQEVDVRFTLYITFGSSLFKKQA